MIRPCAASRPSPIGLSVEVIEKRPPTFAFCPASSPRTSASELRIAIRMLRKT